MMEPHSEQSGASSGMGRNGSSWCGPASVARRLEISPTSPTEYSGPRNLAQMQEGRALLRQVEEARIVENHKWIAFYDARYALEKAKWNVLRLTGEVVASVEGLPGGAR